MVSLIQKQNKKNFSFKRKKIPFLKRAWNEKKESCLMTKAKQIVLIAAIVISCILSGCQASAHSRVEEQDVPEHITIVENVRPGA